MRRKLFVGAIGLLTTVAIHLVGYSNEAEAGRRHCRRARCGTAS